MFWEYGIVASTLDQVFEKDEPPTLENVLNEDDLLQELKVQNDKLVKFLSTSECMENLIKYLTTDTPDNCDPKTRFKYPNLASEVLTAGFTISNLFTETFKYISDLWNYLCDRRPKNVLMICFITKVLGYYACSHPEFMYCFLTEHVTNCVDELLYLIDCPAVCDFIVRLQSRETHPFYPKFVEFFQSSNLIGKIISKLSPEVSTDTKYGLASLCVDLVRSVRSSYEHDSPSDVDERLLLELLSDENLNLIVAKISVCHHDKDTLNAALTILVSLFNYERVGHINGDPFLIPNSLESQSMRCAKRCFDLFVGNISIIQDIIKIEDETRLTPSEHNLVTFGSVKLLAVELLVSLILHPSDILSAEFKRLNTLSILWDLIEKYSMNNFLHTLVHLVTECILQGVRWRGLHDPQIEISDILVKSLFEDVKIVERLLRLSKEPKSDFYGHVTEVLRVMHSCSTSSLHSEFIKSSIESLSESQKTEYNNIIEKLRKVDELQAVDRKFTKGVFNYDENNDDFGTFSSPQFLLSFDKGISLMRTAKESFRFDDNFEQIENDMNININTSYSFEGDALTNLKVHLVVPPMNYQFFNNISPILNAKIDISGEQDEDGDGDDVEISKSHDSSSHFIDSDSQSSEDVVSDSNIRKKKWFDRFSTLDGFDGDNTKSSDRQPMPINNQNLFVSKKITNMKSDDLSRGGTSSPVPLDIHPSGDMDTFSTEEYKDDMIE